MTWGRAFTPAEQEAFDAISTAMEKIQTLDTRGRLKCNNDELARAVHDLQQFPIQHMLHRLWPEEFSDWYTQEVLS
jgi:hypothetical protein